METLTPYLEKWSFTIASQVAFFRRRRGMTQKQLATAIGVSQPMIANLEASPDTEWTHSTLQRICGALNLRLRADLIPNPAK